MDKSKETWPTVTVSRNGIIINIPDDHLKRCFEVDAGVWAKIDNSEAYKQSLEKQILEEKCPHTGASHLEVMLTDINNVLIEMDADGIEECDLDDEAEVGNE